MGCPFCGAPEADIWIKGMDGAKVWACNTPVDGGGDEERYRTHQCYMNQIKSLQTGETTYGDGWRDGVNAMRKLVQLRLDDEHAWLLNNPPMRRHGHRHEDDDG